MTTFSILLEQARLLTACGFPTIPIKDKRPVIEKWTDRRRKLATDQELITWFSNGIADSIAIPINNTEFAIDTDGEGEQIFLEKLLPDCSQELQEKITNTTCTKTPNGYHRTFRISIDDFPDGIPEKTYLTLNGEDHKHNEIALKGRNHYLVEYGPSYVTINDIECLVTLTKEQVDELLYRLEEISPNKDKYRHERLGQPKQQHEQDHKQYTDSTAYDLDDTEVDRIIEKLLPLYQQPSRENIAFTCSGYLHKCEISEDSITKIIQRLASETNDEEYAKRLQAVRDTCAKSRDVVSGRNKFIETLTLIANDNNRAEEMVNSISQIVSESRRNQGGESAFESESEYEVEEDEVEEDDLKGVYYDILQRLSPHVYNVVSSNPPVMYVAHKGKRKIIKAVIKFFAEATITTDGNNTKQEKKTQKQLLLWKHQLIFAIPTKVVINDNPLDGSKTYQITFIARSKKPFTIGPGSIDYIIEELDSRGKVLRKAEAGDALRAILNKYEDMDLAEINDKIPYPGYYWIENQIKDYDVTQNLNLDYEHNEEHRKKILECINIIEGLYVRNKNKVAYSTVLKWSCVAPFSYVKKCIDTSDSNWLPYLHPYGWTRTGKNTLGKIALAINRKLTKKDAQDHIMGFGNVETPARLGNAMSKSTYPTLINEVGALTSEKYFLIVELIKHAVESLNVRGAYREYSKYTNTPALSPLILTSNTPPPSDPAYRIRVIPLRHDKVHETTEQEKAEFNDWAYDKENIYKLGTLGDFAARYIISNPDVLQNKWDVLGKIILTELYKSVGIQVPEWVDLLEKENVIEQSNDETYFGLRGFLEQAIIEGYRKDFRIDPQAMMITFETRLSHCLEYRSVPYLLSHTPRTNNSQKEIVITWNILPELIKHKVPNISTLPALAAEISGFKYGTMKLNGKSKKVVSGRYDDFVKFLNCTVEEEEKPTNESP